MAQRPLVIRPPSAPVIRARHTPVIRLRGVGIRSREAYQSGSPVAASGPTVTVDVDASSGRYAAKPPADIL